jgi:hypothetical protein
MQFTIKVDKIPSVNSLYAYNPRTKSKYLTKDGKLYKDRLKQQLQLQTVNLSNQFIDDSVNIIKDGVVTERDFKKKMIAYDLHVIFFLNSGILSRDTSNLIKATEDAIFEYLDMNDSRVFHISLEKILNDVIDKHDDQEMITVILTPTKNVNNCSLSYILNKFKEDNIDLKGLTFDDMMIEYIKKRTKYV